MTRRQAMMQKAIEHIQAIGPDETVRKLYGGLCHNLPVLILKNGLCETVAFLHSKAGGDSKAARAHTLICNHLAEILGQEDAAKLLAYVAGPKSGEGGLVEYMRATRVVLTASSYYKRFAVSLLGVESGDVTEAPE